VREIAKSETSVSVNAQAILSMVYNEKFPEIIEELKFIVDLRNARNKEKPWATILLNKFSLLKYIPILQKYNNNRIISRIR
jgi:hypothetical protein